MLQVYLSILDSSEDNNRFKDLYYTYSKLLHYIARNILKDDMLAEDAVQEAFLRVAKNFNKVGEVECPQTKKFLVIIVRRVSLTMLGKQGLEELDEAIESHAEKLSYDKHYKREKYSDVVECILNLPETYKHVIYLHYVFQYTAPEVAGLLGISVDAVKKRLQRGKKLVVESFEKEAHSNE